MNWFKSVFGGNFDEEFFGGVVLVGYYAVEDGVFDDGFEFADYVRWLDAKDLHDFYAIDRRLEVADTVALFELFEFDAYEVEIVGETFDFLAVGTCDVAFAEEHKRVDVVACIEKEASHGRVGNFVFAEHDRAHVEIDHLLYELHRFAEWEFEAFEDAWNHTLTEIVVIAEGPAVSVVPLFASRFADVVEQCTPTEP